MKAHTTRSSVWICTLLCVGLVASFLSGCRSYHLGHSAELSFQSIYIRPAGNDSFAPQAQALVSGDLREAFIRDGRVKIVSDEADADVVLLVNLVDYKKTPGSRSSLDPVKASNFDMVLKSMVSLYDQNSGKYLIENDLIESQTTAYTENPYVAGPITQTYHIAEYQAMPQLSRELARRIADRILSAW